MTQGQIILQYQPLLHKIAMRMLRCKADAEDVVQETFMRWLSVDHEEIRNTKAYLVRSVTNNCLNHLKTIRAKKVEYFDFFHWPEFMERFREHMDLSHIDIETELSKAFHVLQDKLEPLERTVYVLKEVFDFDYKSLQIVLDKKQEHCRQLFCRAKKKLNEEKNHFNAVIQPGKAALLESFRKACEFGQPFDLVAQLRMQ